MEADRPAPPSVERGENVSCHDGQRGAKSCQILSDCSFAGVIFSSVSIAAQTSYDRNTAKLQYAATGNFELNAINNDGRVIYQNIRSRPHDTVHEGLLQTI